VLRGLTLLPMQSHLIIVVRASLSQAAGAVKKLLFIRHCQVGEGRAVNLPHPAVLYRENLCGWQSMAA
jgi:hypothetical protein